jgi:hypothetical protein
MTAQTVPRILATEQDYAEAAEAVSGAHIDFDAFSDAELRVLCDQQRLTEAADYDRRTAARMAYLGRLCRRPVSISTVRVLSPTDVAPAHCPLCIEASSLDGRLRGDRCPVHAAKEER